MVKLTDYGRQCLRKNYDELQVAYKGKLPFSYTPPQEDKDGWSKWQCWELMERFGKHISLGRELPFETTIRVLVERAGESGNKPPNRACCERMQFALRHALIRQINGPYFGSDVLPPPLNDKIVACPWCGTTTAFLRTTILVNS